MSDYRTLIERIEHFYIDAVEEFKEAEQQIINDSQFRSIIRKKDYDGNIAKLKECKRTAQDINVNDIEIDADDEESREVAERFNRALAMFNGLCDAYVQLQVFLKKKSMKEPAKFSTYKEIFAKVQQYKEAANGALHDLDMVYTDYTEEYVLDDREDSDE
ncbi:hypothetical protein NE619_13555 [Anaerovorax odorimutans]|uniref:Uncharacterized protein n=1 Tax=Anaerovorax odorimutans TaxID=109327 RepID=A0ABT1RRD1_9FIRM|nr:hypothetical protein [Anaerovorax odorimutans]MCQ4637755.1 hypothetical protein [Anaerovorax odorimutans]